MVSLKVTLRADSGQTLDYLVTSAPNNTATVDVIDNDKITLLISPKVASVLEDSGPAVFTIKAYGVSDSTGALSVRYTPSEVDGSSFLASTTTVSTDLTFVDDGSGNYTSRYLDKSE